MAALDVYLTTPRLVLRRIRPDDGQLLYALDGDPEVRRFLSRERTPYEIIVNRVIRDVLRTYERYPGFGRWIAVDRATGEFVGWFELSVESAGTVTRPELGYRLVRKAWGQGLATEGSRALIDTAFRDLGAEAVFAQTMAVNTGSRRVMEKCGMRFVRTFHPEFDDPVPGTEHGEVEYEITREMWMADPGSGGG